MVRKLYRVELGWISDQRLPDDDCLRIRSDIEKVRCSYLDNILPKESSFDSPQNVTARIHNLEREERRREKGGGREEVKAFGMTLCTQKNRWVTKVDIKIMCPHLGLCVSWNGDSIPSRGAVPWPDPRKLNKRRSDTFSVTGNN